MREIKFRAWDGEEGKMLSQDSLWSLSICFDHGFYNIIKSNRYKVMQYTSLKDKNGKEAYVDDIVKDEYGQIFVVEWDYPLLVRLQEVWFEIIGNIYENPEMLGEEEG